jgi:hypothetical protein
MTMTPLSADPFSSSRERQPYSAPTLRALHGSALSRHVGGLPHFVVASVSQEDMQGLASLLQLQPPIYRFAGLRRLTLLLNVPGVAELSFGLPPNIQELNLKCTDVSGQVHGLLTAANNLAKLETLRMDFKQQARVHELNLAQFGGRDEEDELKTICITSYEHASAAGDLLFRLSDEQLVLLRGMANLRSIILRGQLLLVLQQHQLSLSLVLLLQLLLQLHLLLLLLPEELFLLLDLLWSVRSGECAAASMGQLERSNGGSALICGALISGIEHCTLLFVLFLQLLPPLQRFLLRQPGELSRAQAALRGCEGLGQRSRRGEVRERSDRVTSRNRRGRPEGARQRRAECSTKDWR